jgi:hypothetical protein
MERPRRDGELVAERDEGVRKNKEEISALSIRARKIVHGILKRSLAVAHAVIPGLTRNPVVFQLNPGFLLSQE